MIRSLYNGMYLSNTCIKNNIGPQTAPRGAPDYIDTFKNVIEIYR